jgi:hypothetical protein
MKAKLIKTPEQLYKLKFYNDEDMLSCATALLSKKNCDEIFGVIDVEKLAEEYGSKFAHSYDPEDFIAGFNKAMELYQQQTEIEVEIEMEYYGYCEGCRKAGMWHCAHADTCGYAETRERPKLDSQGCLILTKKI